MSVLLFDPFDTRKSYYDVMVEYAKKLEEKRKGVEVVQRNVAEVIRRGPYVYTPPPEPIPLKRTGALKVGLAVIGGGLFVMFGIPLLQGRKGNV